MKARRFLRSFYRHWRLCALLILASWTTAAVYYFTARVPFESNAKLLVVYIDENPLDAARAFNMGAIMRVEVEQQLRSAKVAEGVVAELGADTLLEGTGAPDAFSVLSQGLTVSTKEGTNVIYLSFRHPNGKTAQAAVTSVINCYFQGMRRIHRGVGGLDKAMAQAGAGDRSTGFLISTAPSPAEPPEAKPISFPGIATIQNATPAMPVTKLRDQMTLALLAAGPCLAALLVTLMHLFRSPERGKVTQGGS